MRYKILKIQNVSNETFTLTENLRFPQTSKTSTHKLLLQVEDVLHALFHLLLNSSHSHDVLVFREADVDAEVVHDLANGTALGPDQARMDPTVNVDVLADVRIQIVDDVQDLLLRRFSVFLVTDHFDHALSSQCDVTTN